MKNLRATFYPDFFTTLGLILSYSFIGSLIMMVVVMIGHNKSFLGTVELVPLFFVALFPVLFIVLTGWNFNYKIKVYEDGIYAPYYISHIPFKWEFIEWSDITSVEPVGAFVYKKNMLVSENNSFVLIPYRIWKPEDFVESIKEHSQNNEHLANMVVLTRGKNKLLF